ncbi:MAG: glycosyltransferase family 2 protein [Candidatus Marinimicrobia bacterium]|nr:glycosyltransferase family 2 protein [Candidatus Neomarinimicrobiota bacterium]
MQNERNYPIISICIAVKNEEKYISRTLDGLLRQNYPKEKMEILLIDGESCDDTVKIAKTYQNKFKYFKILNNPKILSAAGWNIGIKESKSDIIAFLTGHIVMQKDYYSQLIKHLTPEVAGVGGNISPQGTNKRSIQISRAFKSRLGTGGAPYLSGKKTGYVDTITVACYWKKDLLSVGGHDETLVRGQDWDMNMRIVNGGRKLLYIHHLQAKFFVRDKLRSLWKRQYFAGLWKPYIGRKPTGNFLLRHFIPAVFTFIFSILLIMSFFHTSFMYLFLAFSGIYILTIIADNIKNRVPIIDYPIMIVIYFIIHFAYGLGFIIGLSKKYEK